MINETEAKVKEILKCTLGGDIDVNDITLDTNLNSIGVNSIGFIKTVVAIESEFGFEFEDEDLDVNKMETLKDIVMYVESKLSNID